MRRLLVAAIIASSLGLTPAMAGEGNGEPFPNNVGTLSKGTTTAMLHYVDTGSAAYPNSAGRPGSALPSLAGDVLPASGSEGVVQTANSLPAHFEEGTVAYAQADKVRTWMLAHTQRNTPVYAAAIPLHTSGG